MWLAHRLSCYVGSFWIRCQTRVSCMGRWILKHETTGEALSWPFLSTPSYITQHLLLQSTHARFSYLFPLLGVISKTSACPLLCSNNLTSALQCMWAHLLSRVQPFATLWTVGSSVGSSRLLCSWNFPGKNAGVGCHFLLQGIFPTQGSNLHLLCLLHWQAESLPLAPCSISTQLKFLLLNWVHFHFYSASISQLSSSSSSFF